LKPQRGTTLFHGVTLLRLGEVLVLRGIASAADIAASLKRQQEMGGRLGDNLVEIGSVSQEDIERVILETQRMPRSVAETGVSRGTLLNLMLKFMRLESCELLPELCGGMKLPRSVVQELVDEAVARQLIHVLGSTGSGIVRYIRYALSELGRAEANAALEQNRYIGPAPVSLETYQAQLKLQSITGETVKIEKLRNGFGGLVLNDQFLRKLLPAVSAGQTILLYGPPGNGKTSIGRLVASLFSKSVAIPYALEVGGQIIKVYDQSLHVPFIENREKALAELSALSNTGSLQIDDFDERWMICQRPIAVAGGEFSLEMLELNYDPEAKIYDAPLHMKTLNGVFLIDDFGRQKVAPADLLNRWIVPLENRIDYLKLNTGKTISIPFDELVIFSTNLEPADLMDPAFLRRIPYKIHMVGPEPAEYRKVFDKCAAARGLSLSDDVFSFVLKHLTAPRGAGLAYFQPNFICEQVRQVCRCFDLPPVITRELAAEALANLYVEREEAHQDDPKIVGLNAAA
jgi:hypothetical protein